MAYTAPRTWVNGEVLTASLLTTHLRDNLIALKEPPTALYNVNESADYTTSSTSFVNVDADDLSLTVTTTGGRVLITFCGTMTMAAANTVFFDVLVDGARLAGDDGLVANYIDRSSPPGRSVSFAVWTSALAAGSHTFRLQWRVSGSTATLYAGAGTGGGDLHPQFAVREVS